ncbi:MAG: AMP-binding protein, partial [Dehalococcoidia bacterium]|nr:AMP-binding protein [Dehalococcoidia bacterium]
MAISLFKPKEALDPGEALLLASATPLTIPEMLADSRARFADSVAYQQKVSGRWEQLTFDETWRQASEFAAGLIAMGLRPGDRVALICENCLPWVVGYFGLSMAGGVGVPLYVELKRSEIEEMVRRSGARFLIASPRIVERLGEQLGGAEKVIVVGATEGRPGQPPRFLRRGRPDMLPFDEVAAAATDESRVALEERRVQPDDLASIVFTSGTTGGMKGVMLTHKNFMSNIESIRRAVHLDEKDRIVLVLPVHHAFPFIILVAAFAF